MKKDCNNESQKINSNIIKKLNKMDDNLFQNDF